MKFYVGPHSGDLPLGATSALELGNSSAMFAFEDDAPAPSSEYMNVELSGALSGSQKREWGRRLNLASVEGSTAVDVIADLLTYKSDAYGIDRAPPIMPDRNGELAIHFAGRKLFSRRFNFDTDAAKAIVLKQERVNVGQQIDAGVPMLSIEKMVGGLNLKHGRSAGDDQTFTPLMRNEDGTLSDGDTVKPRSPTTTLYDDFERTAEDPIESPWVNEHYAFQINASGNIERSTDPPSGEAVVCRYDSALSASDNYAETKAGASLRGGLAARMTGKVCYGAEPTSTGWSTFRVDASGTRTALANISLTLDWNVFTKLDVTGTTLEIFLNDVSQGSTTNSVVTSGLYVGMACRHNGLGSGGNTEWGGGDGIDGGGNEFVAMQMGTAF